MSIIAELGLNNQGLPRLLEQYEDDLSNYEKDLAIKGKLLGFAIKEQPTRSAYYGDRAIDLGTLVKHFEAQVKKVRAGLIRQYNDHFSISLSDRMLEKYIDGEDAYLSMNSLLLEVKELADKYAMVVDAFNRRGFALRDLTLCHINEIQGVSL